MIKVKNLLNWISKGEIETGSPQIIKNSNLRFYVTFEYCSVECVKVQVPDRDLLVESAGVDLLVGFAVHHGRDLGAVAPRVLGR